MLFSEIKMPFNKMLLEKIRTNTLDSNELILDHEFNEADVEPMCQALALNTQVNSLVFMQDKELNPDCLRQFLNLERIRAINLRTYLSLSLDFFEQLASCRHLKELKINSCGLGDAVGVCQQRCRLSKVWL